MSSMYLNNPSAVCELRAPDQSDEGFHHSLKKIARYMVPAWTEISDESIDIAPLTGGISNMLFVLMSDSGRLIIRLFGNGTELFINRDTENKVFCRLSTLDMAPTFHGLFCGGRVEGYFDARPLDPDEMSRSEIFPKVSKLVARIHAVNMEIIDTSVCLWTKINGFFDLAKGVSFSGDEAKAHLLESINLVKGNAEYKSLRSLLMRMQIESRERFEHLRSEGASTSTDFFYAAGTELAFQKVFCHNDLLSGNILIQNTISVNPSRAVGEVTIIDYEYAGYNSRAYDLANHFNEFAGFDFNIREKFPSKELRSMYIGSYLEDALSLVHADQEVASYFGNNVSASLGDQLRFDFKLLDTEQRESLIAGFDHVLLHFTLVSHFFWGTWSIVQAGMSSIDFDFLGYAKLRYDGYKYHKELFNISMS